MSKHLRSNRRNMTIMLPEQTQLTEGQNQQTEDLETSIDEMIRLLADKNLRIRNYLACLVKNQLI